MQDQIVIGLLMALGASFYNIWGFIEAKKAVDESSAKEKWDPWKTAITVVPSLVLGFLAGIAMQQLPSNIVEYIGMITSGFGLAAAQGKLGINSFFDEG